MPDELNDQGTLSPFFKQTDELSTIVPPEVTQNEPVVTAIGVGQKPNVRLAKSQKDKALPEGLTNIGMTAIVVPDVDGQLAGFYAEDAGVLVAQFPQYKFKQEKGSSHDQNVTI